MTSQRAIGSFRRPQLTPSAVSTSSSHAPSLGSNAKPVPPRTPTGIAASEARDGNVSHAGVYMDSGATGVMFGRNMWLRDYDAALALTRRVHAIMRRFPR